MPRRLHGSIISSVLSLIRCNFLLQSFPGNVRPVSIIVLTLQRSTIFHSFGKLQILVTSCRPIAAFTSPDSMPSSHYRHEIFGHVKDLDVCNFIPGATIRQRRDRLRSFRRTLIYTEKVCEWGQSSSKDISTKTLATSVAVVWIIKLQRSSGKYK